jgi:hypothetical protein
MAAKAWVELVQAQNPGKHHGVNMEKSQDKNQCNHS